MDIIKAYEKIEEIIEKHQDLIGSEAKYLEQEYALKTSQETKEDIEKIDGGNRLLKIGILGRVKAGKSSLLNALLFDGKAILPKAATPMTAALTIISYGDELSAEVDFFNKSDIENIEQEAKEYHHQFEALKIRALEELKKKKTERSKSKPLISKAKDKLMEFSPEENKKLEEQAEKGAKRAIKSNMSLVSSCDQWEKIEASKIDYSRLQESKIVSSDSLENLSQELFEYVGSDGRYMPFTKSVHIKIPQENLKGIQIVDTPGVNDPVQSREERTRELLKFCDVVFIVSPSGQFMSSEDLDLMDRITSKEGIRELYVIASQADLQLHGSVHGDSNGDLQQAFKHITNNLATHLHSTLTTLKNTNPEVGTTYDELIEQSRNKVIHSSGICLTIKEHFEQQELWDEGVKTAWRNLARNYPDYFSDADKELSISSLDLLANMSTVNSVVEGVKLKKEGILAARKDEFIEAKRNSLNKYQQALLKYIDEKIESIRNGNIDELKAKQKKLVKIKEGVSDIVDDNYYDVVKSLEIELEKKVMDKLEGYLEKAEKNVESAEETKTESYEVSDFNIFNPLSFSSIRRLVGLGTKTKHRTYTTVRTGAVRSSLSYFTRNIERSIKNTSKSHLLGWKKELAKSLTRALRGKDDVNDEYLDIDKAKRVIRNILNSIEYPDIKYSGNIPSSLSAKGTLEGRRAEEFIFDAQSYIFTLGDRIIDDIRAYLKQLIHALNNIEISQSIFGNYDELLKQLEEDISNKEIALDRLSRLKGKLQRGLE